MLVLENIRTLILPEWKFAHTVVTTDNSDALAGRRDKN